MTSVHLNYKFSLFFLKIILLFVGNVKGKIPRSSADIVKVITFRSFSGGSLWGQFFSARKFGM